jgi:hypothetical protein
MNSTTAYCGEALPLGETVAGDNFPWPPLYEAKS